MTTCKVKGTLRDITLSFVPEQITLIFEKSQDSNHSDIDVVGINPRLRGHKRVVVASCKSWQNGFRPESKIEEIRRDKVVNGREAWRGFRELLVPKWTEAFLAAINDLTGSTQFTYFTAVSKLIGESKTWEEYPEFRRALSGNPIRVLTFSDILDKLYPSLSNTMASSEIGRVLQLIKASGWNTNGD